MVALFTLLSIVAISIVVNRVATKALEHTGMSTEAARFQSYSAFTGTGFTTEEAESIVNHPVRRRIAMVLMILRNAGLVTAISTLVLSFVGTESAGEGLMRGGLLLAGLGSLVLLARSHWADRYLSKVIDWALDRYTDLGVRDFYTLLKLEEAYSVGRFSVDEGTWLAGKRLNECDLIGEGVLVLGIIHEDGSYVGAPRGRYRLHVGDTLVLYGKTEKLDELEQRIAGTAGERAHAAAKQEHEQELREQDVEQSEHEAEKASEQ